MVTTKRHFKRKYHTYVIDIKLGNVSESKFVINSIFFMEDLQIIELCEQILKDKEFDFIENSLKEMEPEEGNRELLQDIAKGLDRIIDFEYIGMISTFEIKEKFVTNVTATTATATEREVGGQKRISDTGRSDVQQQVGTESGK